MTIVPLTPRKKIGVIGSGSWATALVKILTDNGCKVNWYVRKPEAKSYIETKRHNPNYLSSAQLKTRRLNVSCNMDEVVATSEYLILVIPSAFLHQELESLTVPLRHKVVFSAIKGVIPEHMLIVGEYLHQYHQVPWLQIGVITGPCHAEEIAMERLSYLTLASQDENISKTLGKMFKNSYVRVKISNDVIGTEYSAMLKNIYAIAAGIAHALGYGDNFQSVLMSNAIREMKRFIKNVYKLKRNINNSAYLGDLLVTGYSIFSRNRTFGSMIGKGYTVRAAQLEMKMIAEGYYATKSAKIINSKYKTRIPIIGAVYEILYEGRRPAKVFSRLSKKLN